LEGKSLKNRFNFLTISILFIFSKMTIFVILV